MFLRTVKLLKSPVKCLLNLRMALKESQLNFFSLYSTKTTDNLSVKNYW